MKFVLTIYIALGIVLSLLIGIEYNCTGKEMFPTYYASPFVFKQKSLGSSMEYFYSISGIVLNVAVWAAFLGLLNQVFQKMKPQKAIRIVYHIIIGGMVVFSTLNIMIDSAMLGRGFNENANFWYWNVDKAAEDWGVVCEGSFFLLKK